MQAEAAELSRSRCLGCCQRLGVGKEPGHGDRVSGRGEKAERSEEPAGKGAWGGGHRTKRCSEIKTGRWWGFREGGKGWARAAGTRKAKEVTNACVW